jgi:hypothetical protein
MALIRISEDDYDESIAIRHCRSDGEQSIRLDKDDARKLVNALNFLLDNDDISEIDVG